MAIFMMELSKDVCPVHGTPLEETHPGDPENGPHPSDTENELVCFDCENEQANDGPEPGTPEWLKEIE
jgi:hypothetical protein